MRFYNLHHLIEHSGWEAKICRPRVHYCFVKIVLQTSNYTFIYKVVQH